MENLAKAYEALFMLVCSNIKKALAFAEAIPKEKIYPGLLIGYMKSDNENVRTIAEQLILKARVYNLDYKVLAKAAETDNEEVIRVILLTARRIEKHTLNLVDLSKLTSSKFYGVRQFAYTLIVKNYVNEITFSLLVKCQEVDDTEFSFAARELAFKKKKHVNPISLFSFQTSKVTNVRKLGRDLCLLYKREDYSFAKVYKLMKESEEQCINDLAAQVLLRYFADRLSYDDLLVLQQFENKEVCSLVPARLLEFHSDKLKIRDFVNFQNSEFAEVRAKARKLALLRPADLIDYMELLELVVNESNQQVLALIELLLKKVPVEELDYELLIKWHTTNSDYSRYLASSLLRKMPISMFDPEVLATFQNSHDEDIVKIATELALKIPSDYSKEADEFVKNHFND